MKLFGVRHHGPGCARSLARAFESYRPDCVLIEGPADASALIPLSAHQDIRPPVALLTYRADQPATAAFYPFADYSPEWQAMRWAIAHGVRVEFIDLPFGISTALESPVTADPDPEVPVQSVEPTNENVAEDDAGSLPEEAAPAPIPFDPMTWMARAAGFEDGERWWEHLVETRQDDAEIFEAIAAAMHELRLAIPSEADGSEQRREELREAHMRQQIRAAVAAGTERPAVVCGAWHVPALCEDRLWGRGARAADTALLRGLPRVKTLATWIPWSNQRLSRQSGYGAGIDSPGWYEHLWHGDGQVVPRWMVRVAQLMREEDLDASPASVIETVRLAEALAVLRGYRVPSLPELNDAALSVLCQGDVSQLRLIHQRMVIADRVGEVPEETPGVPLQQDFRRLQTRLRLKVEDSRETIDLDLRQPNDLERSRLLHRLALLGIPWGTVTVARSTGTFREAWRLKWLPEMAVQIIEAGMYGATVLAAAESFSAETARKSTGIDELAALMERAILADLSGAVETISRRLSDAGAATGDVATMMRAVPPLARIARYGSVRNQSRDLVLTPLASLLERIFIGLEGGASGLSDEAALDLFEAVEQIHAALVTLDDAPWLTGWLSALERLNLDSGVAALLAGQSARLRLQARAIDNESAGILLSSVLTPGVPVDYAASWIEGFLENCGQLLLHDTTLLDILDRWVAGLEAEVFVELLPLIRRTFGNFDFSTRRQLGELLKSQGSGVAVASPSDRFINQDRAMVVIPVLRQLLGYGSEVTE